MGTYSYWFACHQNVNHSLRPPKGAILELQGLLFIRNEIERKMLLRESADIQVNTAKTNYRIIQLSKYDNEK